MTDQPNLTLNDGRTMPQIGLGVFQMPAAETQTLTAGALRLGYLAVDTAAIYRNEAGVGAAVRAADAPVFVTSKLWNDNQGHDATLRAFDASMAALGLDVLDLYLIHWPVPARDLYGETWRAMIRLRDEGRIRSIGVSNFAVAHLERIIGDTGIVPVTNQIELHPHFQQAELRAFHEAHRITTTSWSPLGRGAALDEAEIGAIAARLGRTPAQVILRWHVQSGLIVIPKASSEARQAQNLDIFGFALDEDDMRRIAALDRADGRIGPDPEVSGG